MAVCLGGVSHYHNVRKLVKKVISKHEATKSVEISAAGR